MRARGFLLQPTYRIAAGRAVVHLYGRLEDGRTFLVQETTHVPHFWIRTADADRARTLGAPSTPDSRTSMTGDPVSRVDVRQPGDTPALRERLFAEGIECFEADIRFAMRGLIDRNLRGSVDIEGEAEAGEGVDLVFRDPVLTPGDWIPEPTVLSFDIETDPTAHQLLSFSLVADGVSEVWLLTPEGMTCPDPAIPAATEKELLEAFVRRVREIDPDVLTGWNVVDFDLQVLQRLADRERVPFRIGRGPDRMRIRPATTPQGSGSASVEGRLVLDGIDLLRGAFVRMPSYALNAVAHSVLGKGKIITSDDRGAEILRSFHHDRPKLVAYNLRDSELVLEILDKLQVIRLAVQRSRLTGMPCDRVSASIASFDFLYLSELHRRGIVAPSVRASREIDAQTGGHVLEPEPGLYRDVLVLDFKSLYPSVIRTFNIDPLGYLGTEGDGIVAPNGAVFAREPGILPAMLAELFPRREAAKRAGDEVASQAIKILMNSFYGVLGTPACRFARPQLANAITGFGREILLWTKARFEEWGFRVLYGDTDSLFVLSGADSTDAARRRGEELVERTNHALAKHVRTTWGVESHLQLEFDHLYARLLLLAVRGGGGGARKRYAGLKDDGRGQRVVFTGMESVRSDWTILAQRVQRELYTRLFADEPVDAYLAEVVGGLRAGAHDADLVYQKALRKRLDEYTASNPPHVAAARKLSRPPGRTIRYVITVNGPEPDEERRSPLDHEHYVQRQIRPVAEPVLEQLGLDFDRVVGDDTQLELF